MKKLIDLFLTFTKIGMFTFGGGYAMISLIENNCVERKKWISHDEMMNITVIAESTPGPIAINAATFVGYKQAKLLGAIIATLGIVLPSFLIILLVSAVMKKLLKNKYVQAALRGLKPCIIGLVMATGVFMVITHCMSLTAGFAIDWKALLLTVILAAVLYCSKPLLKKKISPISLIIISAVLGIVGYAL